MSDLPRWCPLCPTNGYHDPANCPTHATLSVVNAGQVVASSPVRLPVSGGTARSEEADAHE